MLISLDLKLTRTTTAPRALVDQMIQGTNHKFERKLRDILKKKELSAAVLLSEGAGDNVTIPQRKPKHVSNISLTDMNAVEIAEQNVLLECEIIRAIRISEFLNQAWTKDQKEIYAPNLLAYIEWFTQVRKICVIS